MNSVMYDHATLSARWATTARAACTASRTSAAVAHCCAWCRLLCLDLTNPLSLSSTSNPLTSIHPLLPSFSPPRPLLSNGEAAPADTLPCTVFGPTCDGLDTLLTDYALPELQVTAITAGLQAIAWLRSVGAAGYGLYCTARCRLKHCR